MYNHDDENNINEQEYSYTGEPVQGAGPDNNADSGEKFSEPPVRQPHYEPWREPIYREASDVSANTYSPGHHARSGNGYEYSHYYEAEPKRKKEKAPKAPQARLGVGRTISLVLACVVLCSACSGVVSYFVADSVVKKVSPSQQNQVILGNTNPVEQGSAIPHAAPSNETALSGSDIYALGCQQVVGISTEVTTTSFYGTNTGTVAGSGFIISEDGYILTNYHVVRYTEEYGYPITVTLHDGTTYDATIVGCEDDNDIAVIKIDASGLPAITFGDSDAINVGETVHAIGNPLGGLDYTMTTGSVSALDRVITTEISASVNMFQIDAAINEGNSGGPVYNSRGEVIGVVTAKNMNTGVEGIGFAIPINDAKDIAIDLIENGYVTGKAYLGIRPIDVETYVSQYYNIPEGAYVYEVMEGTCAEKAGIQLGDVITKFGDTDVTSADTLRAALRKYKAGDTVEVTIYRSGQMTTVTVVLDEVQPEEEPEVTEQLPYQGGGYYPGYGYGYGYGW